MQMKKFLSLAFAAVCMLGVMAACSSSGTSKQPPAADVAEQVWGGLVFKDTLVEMEDDVIKNYYNIDWSKVEDKCAYKSGSNATAEEVAVFKMADEADVQLAKDAIAERIEDKKIEYENYIPEEMPKINNALVTANGKYVLLVVADDTEGAQQIFDAQFK